MKSTFRQSMAWLHTWGGLWLTWVLFAIFLTGTLGVFDDAISHWMRDKGRTGAAPALDAEARAGALQAAQAFLAREAPQAEFWSIGLPGEEDPAAHFVSLPCNTCSKIAIRTITPFPICSKIRDEGASTR